MNTPSVGMMAKLGANMFVWKQSWPPSNSGLVSDILHHQNRSFQGWGCSMWMPKSGADLLRLECSPAPENTPSEKKHKRISDSRQPSLCRIHRTSEWANLFSLILTVRKLLRFYMFFLLALIMPNSHLEAQRVVAQSQSRQRLLPQCIHQRRKGVFASNIAASNQM